MQTPETSCTEDRIQHVLERCLSGLGLDSPDKQLWNAGLCVNRWCLEELVKRDPHNFLILLHKILTKTQQVLDQCLYDLVVPLTLLFSSTLLRAPHVSADCSLLHEAYILFQRFLAWPEPCSSATKHLLSVLSRELRAPGISFQRLVRTEQSVSPEVHCSRTMTVLLVNPDEDVPPEVQSVSEQLSRTRFSSRDVTETLVLHGFRAVLGPDQDLRALHTALQVKQVEDLDQLMEAVTDRMEAAASTADPRAARTALRLSMERLRDSLAGPRPGPGSGSGPSPSPGPGPGPGCSDTGAAETFTLPFPKCHTISWDNDNFDFLNGILEPDLDSLPDCFQNVQEENHTDTSVDEEDEAESYRFSSTSSSSRDSGHSLSSSCSLSTTVSTPSGSSGVESDFSEDTEDGKPKLRRKPKKKSRSILGVERFSSLFKSPSLCRRAQSMNYSNEYRAAQIKPYTQTPSAAVPDPLSPRKHVCVRRRPILSCDEAEGPGVTGVTVVKVVVFGGDREAGRLARAYSDLQQKERQSPRLTRTCRLQFYLVPSRRRNTTGSGAGSGAGSDGQTGSGARATSSLDGTSCAEDSTDIVHMLGVIDPWYERNVLSLLSLSPSVLSQQTDVDSSSSSRLDKLPLLADLVLYYCRYADQPVLVQLYQAELILAGGEKRREVFIHSLELGHTAGIRAVRAMGAASKRFGIDEEREAIPLALRVGYNKVAVSGRSRWIQTEVDCTSINLYKSCRKPQQRDSRTESLQLSLTEVLKRQSSKSKKGYNQHISMSEVKVDKVLVDGRRDGTTFAVCLDQDEKKFIQSVTRCEVSLCSKPGSSSDWRSYRSPPGQVQPLNPSYCSLLCLPITTFSTH